VSYYSSKNAKTVPGVADANKHLKQHHVWLQTSTVK